MNPYTKPATSFSEQVELLRGRGMEVLDPTEAEHYLAHLNYYRLRGYWIFFEADSKEHRFAAGTTFNDVLNLYVFDRELRLLIMDALPRPSMG